MRHIFFLVFFYHKSYLSDSIMPCFIEPAWASFTFALPPCSITCSEERTDTLSCPDMMDAISPDHQSVILPPVKKAENKQEIIEKQ